MFIFLITTFFYILVPSLLLVALYRNKSSSYIDYFLILILAFSYILNATLIANWSMTPFSYLHYFFIIAFFIVSYFSFRKMNRKWIRNKSKIHYLFKYPLYIFFIFLFSYQTVHAILAYRIPKNTVDLAFPLIGKNYKVIHGGSNSVMNHHQVVPAQKFALDIVRTNPFGKRAKKWMPKQLEDFYAFGSQVICPCNGVVLKAVDGLEDQKVGDQDSHNVAGNHLIIYSEEKNLKVILAHFKKESLRVKEGDVVTTNQILGLIGNSGNTSEPHLHIHCVSADTEDYFFDGEGLPVTFNTKYLVRNHHISNLVEKDE